MIVLDTNVLKSFALDGPQVAVLRRLSSSTGQTLRLPRIVYQEYVASKKRAIEDAQTKLLAVYDEMDRLIPWPVSRATTMPDPVRCAHEYHGGGLKSIFEIIDPPPGAHAEAISREVWRRLPAKISTSGPGQGARDALLWLTILDFARQHDRVIYLVSTDGAAFGGNNGLHKELQIEARKLQVEVTVLPRLEDLFSALATKAPLPPDFVFNATTETAATREYLYQSLVLTRVASQLGLLGEMGISNWYWVDRPKIYDTKSLETHFYKIEQADYAVVKVQCSFSGVLKYGYEYDRETDTEYTAAPYEIDIAASVRLTFTVERETTESDWSNNLIGMGNVVSVKKAERRLTL